MDYGAADSEIELIAHDFDPGVRATGFDVVARTIRTRVVNCYDEKDLRPDLTDDVHHVSLGPIAGQDDGNP